MLGYATWFSSRDSFFSGVAEAVVVEQVHPLDFVAQAVGYLLLT